MPSANISPLLLASSRETSLPLSPQQQQQQQQRHYNNGLEGSSSHVPDTENPWLLLDLGPNGVGAAGGLVVTPSSVGFLSTPSAGSMVDFAFVSRMSQSQSPSVSTMSPIDLASVADQPTITDLTNTSAPTTELNPQTVVPDHANADADGDGGRGDPSAAASVASFGAATVHMDDAPFLLGGDLMMHDLDPFLDDFQIDLPFEMEGVDHQLQTTNAIDFAIPHQVPAQTDNPAPWAPSQMRDGQSREGSIQESIQIAEKVLGKPSPPSPTPSEGSSSVPVPSPLSDIKEDSAPDRPERSMRSSSSLHKVRSGKIEKSRPTTSNASSRFVIMTPTSINAHAGRANRFECFEMVRPTQKGRKGPLADDTKKSALQVRRLGACFGCHSRKVKCDKDRPCKNCRKLALAVPRIVCWQFPDFIPALFPALLRSHFQKDAMGEFMHESIGSTLVNGEDMPCSISITSGRTFKTTLTLSARFFTPREASDVEHHWHKRIVGDKIALSCQKSVPVRLVLDTTTQKEGVKKQIRDYVQTILAEPTLVGQFTNAFPSTSVPRKVLQIVHNYAERSQSAMVRKSLGIYAMHYLMTRHLSFTRQTVVGLAHTGLVPQNLQFVTSRMLNRQLKLLLDEVAQKEMQQLFDTLSKALKDKSRREWAPCLASFLLLCLFMESVETAVDSFIISQNEICIRNHQAPSYKRETALQSNEEVENLPFRQFAYQFHQIFQTYAKDANTKPFNPLTDDSLLEGSDLDPAAKDMVVMLRALMQGQSWQELDFLTMDPILGDTFGFEEHPFPREVACDYQGRLISKFLLSFQGEKYIYTTKP